MTQTNNTTIEEQLNASEAQEETISKKSSKTKSKIKKDKILKNITRGQIYVQASYNNTIVTVTDLYGNVLGWSSAGKMKFKGPKKSTSYAAGVVIKDVLTRVKQERIMKEANIFVKGIGAGRDAAIRAINANGIIILSIKDITPIPHNGCRRRKPRRV
ncbi:30S ribosomal protein S11 [Candidatus Kuenenbacteria bacterium HGW-Kuenenbacteria-1]|uniref:Small ribosomal subunit protein uS11 n=1 Tax=Candidatus Kuenenbacteria bacterium HGW-Kuenenbacteria-1 TaxID=2013812 RepID=A0A2N1UNJ8_9BACT|nr:MAG: 30S ribosomal protein S11 [Candidatus Kuenenbacteria bacterium HGW-Kuenenbacteria-1]